MRLKEEVDATIRILSDDAPYTPIDRAHRPEFNVKALDRKSLKVIKVD